MKSTYTPPATFTEFLEQHPRLVPAVLAKRRSHLRNLDLEDLTQEVYLHLMSLPEQSLYRERGCTDRISTFDPTLVTDGNVEGAFVGYIVRLIENYLWHRRKADTNKLIAASTAIEQLASGDGPVVTTDDEVLGRCLVLGYLPYDSDWDLDFEAFLDMAFEVHPMVAYAAVALTVYDTQVEVYQFLRVTEEKLAHLIKGVRAIYEGDVATLNKFRVRREYAPRKKRGAPSDTQKQTTAPSSRRKSPMKVVNLVLVCICTLLMSIPALAQNRVQFVSSSAKNGSPVPAVCIQQAQVAVSIIQRYPHPDTWTWVVVCDDLAWQRWERHISWEEQGSPLLALTDRASKVTYLRGPAILHPAMSAAARPEHVIAHELGHIMLNSSDESAVDKLA